ncbi:MAG: sodium:proton antiporter [Terrimicrobiaceae bacterium]|nr:sodium:proton antiporter [Terrimicrobiaceae bacterium]
MPALIAAAAHASDPSPWMLLPFAAMLLSIAVMPFVHAHWWERHYPKVALALGAITAGYYLFALQNGHRMLEVAHEYFSFMSLIGSLFVVAGGIHITVKGEARPWINALFLFVGAVLANFIGTTGASMLLIRPWVRMNKYRVTAYHIVFFIFIVSNVGGCLTPIGDPPLFLGFLKGVPFLWVIENCWAAWAIVLALLIAVFTVIDARNFRRAPIDVRERETAQETWRFDGLPNVFFLGLILAGVFLHKLLPFPLPDLLMLAAATASYFTTARPVHESNHFTFAPILEVGWLFVGIFATMVPALDYLSLHSSRLGLDTPMQFYWCTGVLSGFLDNAPTYLTFLAAAAGAKGLSIDSPTDILRLIETNNHFLVAISLGAVFFGALTYIGNGPNLMVKSISRQLGVRTPGFFGYLFLYALPILLPIFGLVALLFFS